MGKRRLFSPSENPSVGGALCRFFVLPKLFAAKPKEQQEKTENLRPVEKRRSSRRNMIKVQQTCAAARMAAIYCYSFLSLLAWSALFMCCPSLSG